MPPRRQRLARVDSGVVTFDRTTFFGEVWDYTPGDHCTFLAPFGGGKTQIALQALDVTDSPDLKSTIFVMKPKDVTITRFMAAHPKQYELIRDWPPGQIKLAKRAFGGKVNGYVLWPRESPNLKDTEYYQGVIFSNTIRSMYRDAKKHPNIMFIDETYSMENELKDEDGDSLSLDLRRSWTKGRSVGNGLWAASQRPANISQYAYQAQHLFIGRDDDARAQQRYAEIGGGFDPDVVKGIISSLDRYEFLYISREERAMCIIGAS